MSLLDLPPSVLARVMVDLADVGSPCDVLSLQRACKQVQLLVDEEDMVWRPLCSRLEWLRGVPPGDYNALNYKHLYLGLVWPFLGYIGDWHAPMWLAGYVIHVEPRPPALTALSVHYKSLNGTAYCHPLFKIELSPFCYNPQRAQVTCLRRQDSPHLHPATLTPAAPDPSGRPPAAAAGGSAGPAPGVTAPTAAFTFSCRTCVPGMLLFMEEFMARHIYSTPYQWPPPPGPPPGAPEQPQLQPLGADGAPQQQQQHRQHPAPAQPPAPQPQPPPLPDLRSANGSTSWQLIPVLEVIINAGVGVGEESLDGSGGVARQPPLFRRLPSPAGGGTHGQLPRRHPLEGLWRGSYGSHGVELIQVLFEPCGAGSAPGFCGGLDGAAAPLQPPLMPGAAALVEPVAQDPQQQGQQEGAVAGALGGGHTGGAAAAAGAAEGGGEAAATGRLLCIKITGDMNVPAGRLSVAADLSAASTQGAGQALRLPPSYDTDVRLESPGCCTLRVKERYPATAQIAQPCFRNPSVIRAELLAFDRDDAFGVIWHAPCNSFSLFSRITQLV